MMASRVEWERWKHGENSWHSARSLTNVSKEKMEKHVYKKPVVNTSPPKPKPTPSSQLNTGSDASKLFDELFG